MIYKKLEKFYKKKQVKETKMVKIGQSQECDQYIYKKIKIKCIDQ